MSEKPESNRTNSRLSGYRETGIYGGIMEILFEIVFEIIVDGSLKTSTNKKVPLWIRIIAGIVLIAVYGGSAGALMYIGIRNKDWILLVIGIALLVFFVFGFRKVYKKYRNRQENTDD